MFSKGYLDMVIKSCDSMVKNLILTTQSWGLMTSKKMPFENMIWNGENAGN